LSEVAAVVAEVGFAQSPSDQPAGFKQIAQSQRQALEQYSIKQMLADG
jgi:hypothetical protein